MTATLPQAGPPTQGGPRLGARYGAIYAYDVLDHHNGHVVPDDYVGQSRTPGLRDRQHRGLAPQRDGQVREQPWADLIVGGQRIVAEGCWTDEQLDAAEARHIATRQPRYNIQLNWANPNRIKPWEAETQRAERDADRARNARAAAVAHLPWWRQMLGRAAFATRQATDRAVHATTARIKAGVVAALPWLAAAAGFGLAGVLWAGWTAEDAAGVAVAGAAAGWLGWRKLTRPTRRGRTTRRRTR